ncbi:MAG: hypothetical protein A2Y62_16140 [Candidatus Fischerbacteria bacterium RBG_13_37_8]|uniref:Uncharacterized protein n=1 Tax=Candidatus Fischerbacteria bacterium RBG_13_37_8 TaxID=1817863 RepID=A0A1F5VEC8_9BACT|nr:MAG: hypothetical protein A2Y62_16140 [Candidatus Fischerbacteria bacterium RBG_13_37_8]
MKYAKEFIDDINSDLIMFEKILDSLHELKLVKNDPKTNCLLQNLRLQFGKEPKRKIVIFSEYVDTVKYLEPYLEKLFEGRILIIAGDLSASKLDAIYKNNK